MILRTVPRRDAAARTTASPTPIGFRRMPAGQRHSPGWPVTRRTRRAAPRDQQNQRPEGHPGRKHTCDSWDRRPPTAMEDSRASTMGLKRRAQGDFRRRGVGGQFCNSRLEVSLRGPGNPRRPAQSAASNVPGRSSRASTEDVRPALRSAGLRGSFDGASSNASRCPCRAAGRSPQSRASHSAEGSLSNARANGSVWSAPINSDPSLIRRPRMRAPPFPRTG